jgi:hypothetical protein
LVSVTGPQPAESSTTISPPVLVCAIATAKLRHGVSRLAVVRVVAVGRYERALLRGVG